MHTVTVTIDHMQNRLILHCNLRDTAGSRSRLYAFRLFIWQKLIIKQIEANETEISKILFDRKKINIIKFN